MEAICGAKCDECELFKSKKCQGCASTNGSPFGKKCWIANYKEFGGRSALTKVQKDLMEEFNSLNIKDMPEVKELYPLHGSFVNLEYPLPSGIKAKFLNDDETYYGNQLTNKDAKTCYGVIANMKFLLVSKYGLNGENPEIIIYKKR